ncbi:MAG: nucleotidyltransferase domain-containing protein [bacterium]|nr:nucleotidyltransferase domain-containing protein [bacterium]
MTHQETKEYIAGVIRDEFKAKKITINKLILFGSQARQNAGPGCDWDFLVSVAEELGFQEKTKLSTSIQRKLAVKHLSADIIIKSEMKIDQERNNVGFLTYYALKDGVPA